MDEPNYELDLYGVDGPLAQALWRRADRVLPGGAMYVSRSADLAGRGNLPGFVAEGEGPWIVDIDGRRYIDFLCANGPVVLGYRHPEVEAAVQDQLGRGDSLSFFPPVLVTWIETLLERFPGFAWGVSAKNGSDVVALALRVVRRATGRRQVVAFEHGYHGFDAGVSLLAEETAVSGLIRLPYGDAAALEACLAKHGEDVAAVLLNPLDQSPGLPTRSLPSELVTVLHRARSEYGVRVVLDDVRHGLRLDPNGSHVACGLQPDLLCLGKAIGNGHPVAALLGVAELQRAAAKVPFTASYAFGAAAMRAGLATLDVYAREGVFASLVERGEQLREGLYQAAAVAGQDIEISGPATMPSLRFEGADGRERGRRFAREAARRGAIFHPSLNWFLCAAHTEAVVEEALEIADAAFQALDPTS